ALERRLHRRNPLAESHRRQWSHLCVRQRGPRFRLRPAGIAIVDGSLGVWDYGTYRTYGTYGWMPIGPIVPLSSVVACATTSGHVLAYGLGWDLWDLWVDAYRSHRSYWSHRPIVVSGRMCDNEVHVFAQGLPDGTMGPMGPMGPIGPIGPIVPLSSMVACATTRAMIFAYCLPDGTMGPMGGCLSRAAYRSHRSYRSHRPITVVIRFIRAGSPWNDGFGPCHLSSSTSLKSRASRRRVARRLNNFASS